MISAEGKDFAKRKYGKHIDLISDKTTTNEVNFFNLKKNGQF